MTTPPKARRFHASTDESVRRTGSKSEKAAPKAKPKVRVELRKKDPDQAAPGKAPQSPPESEAEARERFMFTEPVDDGFGDFRLTEKPDEKAPEKPAGKASGKTAEEAGDKSEPGEDREAKLKAIREERLSERQLRIARRIASLHQIKVASDEEAVLELRERGIDPSHRAALKQILSSEGHRAGTSPAANTPAIRPPSSPPAVKETPGLPSREDMTEARRAAEIYRIQQEMAARRRRRLAMLGARVLVFVILPTILAGWYYYAIATPLYATKSQFQIQTAETSGSATSGGLFGSSPLANNTDSVAVQSYLTSRAAMLRLNEELGFKDVFQDPALDSIKRLPENATNEEAYEVYRDSVIIGYDPTEGMINMEVIAPDPKISEEFSRALIRYAEEQVDNMTSRLRDDQMEGARRNYEDAEAKVLEAQQRVQEAQTQLGVLDPQAESSVVMTQITQLESQLTEKRLELGQLLTNPRPVQSRVEGAKGDIARLEQMIAETRKQLTQDNDTRNSLAQITGELRIAEGELLTRQELLASAAEQLEAAQIEANKQVRYLSMSVSPIPPDEATYPRAFQNTLVAFLIFMGIYLMLSLTVSILREQVST
ncbi:capsule biosynthesis protein [Paracoccus alkanivorans]|uniref:Capsule biosynthesis protein n=1 Tax=Paracoccus alkanivorans TaxID=2116655 RepID=A0A3M0MGR3_9RHOB|nr:capsule biosynthesis protein [Paracoccus alkanivorans]RMC36253.1 capsule biosynthesis protein [Paracoccus alkanivorans]